MGTARVLRADGSKSVEHCTLQSWLKRFLNQHTLSTGAALELPFDFKGGLVGFIGYEMKAESGGAIAHRNRYASLFIEQKASAACAPADDGLSGYFACLFSVCCVGESCVNGNRHMCGHSAKTGICMETGICVAIQLRNGCACRHLSLQFPSLAYAFRHITPLAFALEKYVLHTTCAH
jgi:hypothetical protein